MKTTSIILTALASFATAQNNVFARTPDATPPPARTKPADYKPCPTTLTKTANAGLDGCTTTIFEKTSTEGVDCGGCKSLVTVTTHPLFFGLGPACVGGQKTVSDEGTTTVTSCKVTSTAPPACNPPQATK